jgi:Ca-activated chloride channel family protein
MTFAWPWALAALLAIPLVLGIAWWTRRRRRRAAVRVTSGALVRAALPGRTLWRRRIPSGLLVLGIAVLGIGAARPQASVTVTSNSTTILLALDVSGSMCSTDVAPNRLDAAEKAAAAFIKAQPAHSRIGLVTFAGVAGLLVPPTNDTGKLLAALQGLTTSRGTAIGQGILTAIDAIADVDPSVAPTGVDVDPRGRSGYAADVIVVLTDGANTQGVDPQTAATQAAARGLRTFTIGFGTTTPAPLVCDRSQTGDFPGSGGFGGGGFGGGGFRDRNPLVIDEGALQQVAATTGGRYYRAQNADQLQDALKDLPSHITVTHNHADIADWFAGIGGLLVAAAIGLSLWWNRIRRMPPATAPPGTG